LDLEIHVKPKQTTSKERTIVHFNCQEKEKKEKTQIIDHQRQSNYDMSTCVTPCARGHGYASSDTMDGQIWLLGSGSRASLMAQAPPTCLSVWNMHQHLFNLKIQNTT
jgi:hypothetical protein